jgi:hypothetical protein
MQTNIFGSSLNANKLNTERLSIHKVYDAQGNVIEKV